ncbi:MAG: hypothetical protein JXA69_12165 [Phycisphaerae bacterium]|nr:hypothetical protein [Phycisphaerae bacterium]
MNVPVSESWRRMRMVAFAAVLMVAAVGGCAGPRATPPSIDPQTLDDMSFMHDYLVTQPTVTVDEAYRAILILADGEDPHETFDARRADLEARGITRPAWKLQADHCIDKGSAAYMVCVVLKIQGGLNRVIFGSWGLGDRRYALRELVYRELMADAPAYRYITGAELAGLMRKADEYMEQHGLYEMDSVELGEEPPAESPLSSSQ